MQDALMRIAGIASAILLSLIISVLMDPSVDGAPEGSQSDPVFTLSFEGEYLSAYVEPGKTYEATMNGIIQAYMDVLVPGQKIMLDLQVISGTWPSSVTPSTIEFTRLTNTAAITMSVSVPPGTPATENNLISLTGRWWLDPGTNEGDMPPYTMSIHVMPYSRVNITVDDDRRTGTIGDDIEFRTTFHNNGNMIDHYRVYVECEGDCTAETDDLNVTVQVSGTADAVIVVRQEKGSPGTKRFVVHAIGMYRGTGEHAKMDLFIVTKLGPAAFLTQPWSLLIAGILILFVVAISIFGGRWFFRRSRIRAIQRRGK